jgi:hypothetical protein
MPRAQTAARMANSYPRCRGNIRSGRPKVRIVRLKPISLDESHHPRVGQFWEEAERICTTPYNENLFSLNLSLERLAGRVKIMAQGKERDRGFEIALRAEEV